MDLKKFKLLSVILLAAAVLFLSVDLIRNKAETENMSFSVAEDISRLYASHGITLDPAFVPLYREKPPVYTCPTADGAAALIIAEKISNAGRAAANITDTEYIFRLDNGAIATVSGGYDLSYNLSSGEERTVTYKPTSEAMEKAEALLERLMGDRSEKSESRCEYSLASAAKIGNNIQLEFDVSIGEVKLCGKSLSVYVDPQGSIFAARGICCFSELEKQSGTPRYDIISVMKAELDRLENAGITGLSVESVEPCYIAVVSYDDGTLYFLPGWEISYSDGTSAAYDGVNCEKH